MARMQQQKLTAEQRAWLRTLPITDKRLNRIKFAMSLMGYRNEDLIRGTGLAANTISQLINGHKKNPRMTTLYRCADYFGCSVDDLCTNFPGPPRPPTDEIILQMAHEIVSHPKWRAQLRMLLSELLSTPMTAKKHKRKR